MNKPYLLFAYHAYYPCGGWDDFEESFATLKEARSYGKRCLSRGYDYHHVVDVRTLKEVAAG